MKKSIVPILAVLVFGAAILFSVGYEEKTEAKSANVPPGAAFGQVKGTDACCSTAQATCDGAMDKGSTGDCAVSEGAESAALCGSCAQIDGSEACCQSEPGTCAECSLGQGTTDCNKVPVP